MSFAKKIWSHAKSMGPDRQKKEKSSLPSSKANVVLLLTDRCNFSCRHCLRNSASKEDLDPGLAKRIIREATNLGYRHFSFTGGEPLVYPHLAELIKETASRGSTFSIVSNGFLFETCLDVLKNNLNNLVFIAFSLESADQKKHDSIRKSGSYAKLMEAFGLCRKWKIPFRVITALSTANFDELFDIALLARRKGANCLALTTVLPCPRSNENRFVLTEEKREEIPYLSLNISKIIKIPVYWGADIRTCGPMGLCGIIGLNEVAINTQGEMVLCCELANFDDPSIRKKCVITSLKNSSFNEGIKAFTGKVQRMVSMRVDDLKNAIKPDSADLNSCFYCVNKLGAGPE